jgi:hypothetical protein
MRGHVYEGYPAPGGIFKLARTVSNSNGAPAVTAHQRVRASSPRRSVACAYVIRITAATPVRASDRGAD